MFVYIYFFIFLKSDVMFLLICIKLLSIFINYIENLNFFLFLSEYIFFLIILNLRWLSMFHSVSTFNAALIGQLGG